MAWGGWGVTAVCFGGVITGTFAWGAGRVRDTLGGATELGMLLFSLTHC